MKHKGEEGAALAEVLVVAAILALLAGTAVPLAVRIYNYGAVRYEAEHLLSELRYEQTLARTAVSELDEDGSVIRSGTRPWLVFFLGGYEIRRQNEVVKRHYCLPNVSIQFKETQDEREKILYFGPNGNVFPSLTIKVLVPGKAGASCKLVVDNAGRIRLERSSS